MSETFLEQALEKSDVELFKELFRIYPLAQVEDYYQATGWQNALMQMDLQLFLAQRQESGALPPPALEDLTLPKLPVPGRILETPGGEAVVKPPADPVIREPVIPKALPQAETLQILVFVNKHGLDLTKTKALLGPLELSIRGPLMADFSPGADGPVLTQLQDFMQKSGISFERIEVPPPMASEATKVAAPLAPASAPTPVPATVPATVVGPRAVGPLKPGRVEPVTVPATVPAKAPAKAAAKGPPVKTPPVRPLISPKPPATVPPKHLLAARGPVARGPVAKGPAAKAMPFVLAAKLPTKRPLETPSMPLQKRPNLVPQRPKVVPERPQTPHVVRPKVAPAPYPVGMPVPSLPLRPWW